MANRVNYKGDLTAWYCVSDMIKAIEWYQNVLGFKLQYKMDEMGWCEMETGAERVSLGLSQTEKVEKGGGAVLVFGVTDIESAVASLKEQGVKFDGDIKVHEGFVKLATFYDPDGNTLMFSQSLTGN
jgi:predicted enzyme related to lactoylglutathione lyase